MAIKVYVTNPASGPVQVTVTNPAQQIHAINVSPTLVPGPGVPSGGAAGDLLVKNSATNFDTAWTDSPTVDKLTFDTAAAETLNAQGHIEKTYTFDNFADALAFTNRVGNVAEIEGHHPDIYLAWGKCKVEIWTHKIQGLTESDFYLAAKADRAFQLPPSY